MNCMNAITGQNTATASFWGQFREIATSSIQVLPKITVVAVPLISILALSYVASDTIEEEIPSLNGTQLSHFTVASPTAGAVGCVQDVALIGLQGMFAVMGMLGAAAHVNRIQQNGSPINQINQRNYLFNDIQQCALTDVPSCEQIQKEIFDLSDKLASVAGDTIKIEELVQKLRTKFDLYSDLEKNFTRREETIYYLYSHLHPAEEMLTHESLKNFYESIRTARSISSQSMESAYSVDALTSSSHIVAYAHRTVDLHNLHESHVMNRLKEFQRSASPFSFLTLSYELSVFLDLNLQHLTDEQKIKIKKTALLFEDTARIYFKIMQKRHLQSLIKRGNGEKIYEKLSSEIQNGLVTEIRKTISTLVIGDRYLLPGGYSSPTGSHFVLYEIQRVSDQKFHLTIFNTGAGIEWHQSDAERKTVHSVIIPNIDATLISGKDFISKLVSFYTDMKTEDMYEIYSFIARHFNAWEDGPEIYRAQTWGSCIYSPLEAFLENRLPGSLFPFFKYRMVAWAREGLRELLPESSLDSELIELIDAKSCEAAKNQKMEVDALCSRTEPSDYLLAELLKIEEMSTVSDLKEVLNSRLYLDFRESKIIQELEQFSFLAEVEKSLCSLFRFFSVDTNCISHNKHEQLLENKNTLKILLDLIARKSPKTAKEINNEPDLRKKALFNELRCDDLQATFDHLKKLAQGLQEPEPDILCTSIDPNLPNEVCPDFPK